jgi:hypothetical protein
MKDAPPRRHPMAAVLKRVPMAADKPGWESSARHPARYGLLGTPPK